LRQHRDHFAFGLQEKSLWVSSQFARSQQIISSELGELFEAGCQAFGKARGQSGNVACQSVQSLQYSAVLQSITASQIALDIAGDRLLKLLRELEVALHQLIGTLQRTLRPPERGAQ